jgi:hypothetical protein
VARAADGAPRRDEEGAEPGAAAAGSAQRLLHFNMAEPPRQLQLLQRLMAAQQGVHRGALGGLDRELTPEELDALQRHATRFRCESVRSPFSLAPDEPDAHEAIHKHITILMDKLIAAKWFLKDLESVALEWLAGQFTGRAAEKWTRVVAAARVTATTSGIAHNSVLYRCLRDMVLAYPAVGIKDQLQMRRLRERDDVVYWYLIQ